MGLCNVESVDKKKMKHLEYLAIIIVVVILLFGFYNKKSNNVLVVPGVYCCIIDNDKFYIDYKKEDSYTIYLDTISNETKVNVRASFFGYDSIGFEKSMNEIDIRSRQMYYNAANSVCHKIDNDKNKYYVVLYATYKNRWYERKE